MGPRLTPQARHLLRSQRDLIADWQAPEVGLHARSLQRACTTGWLRHGAHVFSDRTGDATPAQLRMIAVLETGPDSLLTGRAALVEAGWTLDPGDHVDVLVPRSLRGRRHKLPWLRHHYPISLPVGQGVPLRAHPARAAIDAASWARTPRETMLVIVSVVQQRLTSPQGLSRELRGRGQLPRRRWIDEAMREVADGARSTGEADFLRECRRRGLPAPTMQRRRRDAHGMTRYSDAEFRLPDGRVVMVEIDGAGHREIEQWHADLARHNALTVSTGALTLRVTTWEVRNDPDPFFALLGAAIDGVVIQDASYWQVG